MSSHMDQYMLVNQAVSSAYENARASSQAYASQWNQGASRFVFVRASALVFVIRERRVRRDSERGGEGSEWFCFLLV